MKLSITRPAILLTVFGSLSTPAHAYLDPATGSIAVQAIIGAVATWVMYSKLFARKVKDFLSRLTKGHSSQDAE